MPDPDSPLSLRGVLTQPLIVTVDLVHNEVPRWEQYLSKSLNDKKFQAHIQSVIGLQMQAQLGLQSSRWGITGPPAAKIGKGMLNELSSAAQRELEDSKSYQRLHRRGLCASGLGWPADGSHRWLDLSACAAQGLHAGSDVQYRTQDQILILL